MPGDRMGVPHGAAYRYGMMLLTQRSAFETRNASDREAGGVIRTICR